MAKRGYESQKTGQKVDDLLDKIDNLNVPEWALQESKPSYTAQEVHALPENTSIPRKTSDLVNDRGFITQESDPTVPGWAKQPSKPGYTAQEVGALPSDTPLFSGDYNDLRNKPTIPTVPENVSAFNNDAGYLTVHQDISGKEDKSNKVTSLSVQNTDTQYPSAKAVFDNLSTKQDTINDLGSIRSGASAGATAYQKPEAGIPESDLSQGVKDKMNEKEVFWAEYGTTTAAEIDAAIAAGKVVYTIYSNQYCPLVHITNDYYSFVQVNRNIATVRLDLNRSTSVWSVGSFPLELASRKVTSWSATPDNTHYPSEKLVKDSLDAIDKLVEVEYGVTTYAEVKALWDDGKIPFIIKDYSANLHIKLYCTSHNDYGVAHNNTCFFFSVLTMISNTRLFTFTRLKYNDTWENLGQYYPEVTNSKSTNLEQHKTSDNYYPSTKAVADYVHQETAKWGVVSQKITWNGSSYTLTQITNGWVSQELIDQASVFGIVFNTTTGYFEYCGYTDLSAGEVRKVVARGVQTIGNALFRAYADRIVLPIAAINVTVTEIYYFANRLKEIPINLGYVLQQIGNNAFNSCTLLESIYLVIYGNSTGLSSPTCFNNCTSLKYINFYTLQRDLYLGTCPAILASSVAEWINGGSTTTTYTITLHPTAYARAIADSDVQAALQAHTNVSLASA